MSTTSTSGKLYQRWYNIQDYQNNTHWYTVSRGPTRAFFTTRKDTLHCYLYLFCKHVLVQQQLDYYCSIASLLKIAITTISRE